MKLPIFPLNGAVLFPGTSLPLNIFEERYLNMVDYAMANERYIGMIQTDKNNNLYKVGCIGRIHSFNETNDGRYLISLQGSNCFKVKEELESNLSFRIVNASIIKIGDEDDLIFSDFQKNELLQKYRAYLQIKKIKIDLDEIEKISVEQLIKFIAMVSPLKDIEKQALLETKVINEFYKKLMSILELELIDSKYASTIN